VLRFGLEIFAVRMQKQRPGDQRDKTDAGERERRRLGQTLHSLPNFVGAKPKHRRPDNGAGGIGDKEAQPRHAIDAGKHRSQHSEQRDEAAEEDNFSAVSLE